VSVVDAVRYRLVVEGELGPRYASAFEEMEVESEAGNTILVGDVVDQSHLQGLLDRVARLGLNLVSVAPAEDRLPPAAPPPRPKPASARRASR
jgi:hypothetical protein